MPDIGTSKFARDYETAAWDRVREREKARAYREERADAVSAFWENVGPDERAAMVEVAYEALLPKNVATAHPSQRKLIRQEMWRERCEKYGRPQTNKERLEEGYIWDGQGTEDENGNKTYLVCGKYLQKPFIFKGLKRDEDEFVMRFVAAMPRASSGILMTGMGKDECHRQNRKLAALDNTHGFFCERVREMVRIDIQKTWASKAALQADLDKLPFKAQLVVNTTDDRYPDEIIDPHFYHILPEGKGVWNNKKHHKLLNRVIAGLNKMYMPLGCDPGGMSMPFHGKLVTSPHNDYFVPEGSFTVDDDGNRVIPTLGEYARGLDISMGLEKMARHLSRAILSDAGFDAVESNTYSPGRPRRPVPRLGTCSRPAPTSPARIRSSKRSTSSSPRRSTPSTRSRPSGAAPPWPRSSGRAPAGPSCTSIRPRWTRPAAIAAAPTT
jgi:hypothetical protein